MDLAWLGPLGTFLGVVGGGVAWWFNRKDKRREANEERVRALLEARVAQLEQELANERARHAQELQAEKSYAHKVKVAAGQWREQLIRNDIIPDPAEWPEDPRHAS